MPCTRPLRAYKSLSRGDNGKYGLTFNSTKALIEGSALSIPCGACLGCRMDRSREWAIRCYHESQMHSANSFITLTYDDEHLPPDFGVHKRVWQLFMKKLRKQVGVKIRFFACGEYTEPPEWRPHYHALLFGYQFPDLVRWTQRNGKIFYRSKSLEQLWPNGFSLVSDVNLQSAGYVARYIMKKVSGDDQYSVDHYTRVHPVTNQLHQVDKEFCLMSRKPGLGQTWFEKYKGDAFPSDFVIVDGRKMPVPKFYNKKLIEEELERYKRARKQKMLKHKADNTPERLKVREEIMASRVTQLKRDLK